MLRLANHLQNGASRRVFLSAPCRRTLTSQSAQKPDPPIPNKQAAPVSWMAFAVATTFGTAGLAYYSYERERRMKEIRSPKTIGRAAIGGPFTLIDEHDKPFTEENLLGHWSLVYFGFTMCPDICPEELTKISEALAMVEKHGRKVASQGEGAIVPIFITIDPERDSSERSAEYARTFHPAFVGLSGSLQQVTDAAKVYRVYFSKDESDDDDYLVDHSIISYLMDPNGEFQEFYGKSTTALEIAAKMEARLLSWKPS